MGPREPRLGLMRVVRERVRVVRVKVTGVRERVRGTAEPRRRRPATSALFRQKLQPCSGRKAAVALSL